MATGSKGTKSATTVPPVSATKTAAQTPAPASAGQPADLLEVIQKCSVVSTLNATGKAYVEQYKAIIAEQTTFKVVSLSSDGREGLVTCTDDGKYAILQILADGCRYDKELSPASLIPEFVTAWKIASRNSDAAFTQAVVVTPDEYDRVERNANTAINILKTCTHEIRIDLNTMTKLGLNVSTNRLKAIDFIKAVSPHAVLARNDLALTISVDAKGEIIHPASGYNQQDYRAETVIASIVGYTDFIEEGIIQGERRFRPIVTITDVVSIIPSPKILAILLPLVADAWISKRGWLAPFRRLGSGSPNIGNLVRDAKKKPMGLGKIEELEAFVSKMLLDPILSIDVPDGRYRHPGIDAFVAPNATPYLTALMDTVFGNQVTSASVPSVSKIGAHEYIGVYRENELKDSRYLDYLEFTKTISNTEAYDRLLQPSVHPNERLRVQMELVPEIVPMYIVRKAILVANFVNVIAAQLSSITSFNITQDYGNMPCGLPNLDDAVYKDFVFNVGSNAVQGLTNLPTYQHVGY